MQLAKAFDSSALVSALKSSSLADAPKVAGDLLSIALGWVAASLVLLVASSPGLAILSSLVPELASLLQQALASALAGIQVSVQPIVLSKAWDTSALYAALKAAGVPDAEKLVADDMAVVFDWAQSSLAMGSPLEQMLAPLVQALAQMVSKELASVAASV